MSSMNNERKRHRRKGGGGGSGFGRGMNSGAAGAVQPYDYRSISTMADTLPRKKPRNDTERLTDSSDGEDGRHTTSALDGKSEVGTSKKNDDSISRLASQRLADIRENFHEELSETAVHGGSDVSARRKRKITETLSGEDDSSDDEVPAKKCFDSGIGSLETIKTDEREDEMDKQQLPSSSSSSSGWQPKSDDRGAALLAKMGYGGGGLGKSGQGRTELIPMSTQRGRIGLGHQANQSIGRDLTIQWDPSVEEKSVDEHVLWLDVSSEKRNEIVEKICDEWMVIGKRKEIIDDEDQYCDGEILRAMLSAKSVFDDLNDRDLREARSRANPYETIGSAFFQNRAAVKVANMDRVFDWLLTKENPSTLEKKNPVDVKRQPDGTLVTTKEPENCDRKEPLFYFADVCAGPGGFTEYVLWRKGFYNAKGFGFTLIGKDDFKLERFTASSPEYFEPYYGKHGDGDVMKPENIISLEEVVMRGTNNVGVDLMMADGGFSVEGKENIQEILSKRLYLCQFLVALSIVRPADRDRDGGVFFCKLFDIFTPFSVGLVYLMYIAFKRISLHKPNTSRPANSERYIICEGLSHEGATKVKDYLTSINNKLDELEKSKLSATKDVNEVVPKDIIQSDQKFMEYLVSHNESMAKRQTQYLDKYRSFAKNQGQIDMDQAKLREDCLNYWRLPDVPRRRLANESLEASIGRLCRQVIDFEQLRRRPPPFKESVMESDNDSRMRFAELRMCALTEKEQPTLLFSVRTGIFIRSANSMSGFEKLDILPRIPRDTVLYVQKTMAYSKLSDQGKPEDGRWVIRVLDGAVLNGDDISGLSYDDRMQAITKLCAAVNCVHQQKSLEYANTSNTKSHSNASNRRSKPRSMAPSNLVIAANVYKFDELGQEAEHFNVIRWKGEELAVIEESSHKFICRGMRIVSLLADPWVLCWSKGQKKPYVFDKSGRHSAIFCDNSDEKQCWASFWRTIVPKKSMTSKAPENYQWHWDWAQDFLDGNGYGPKSILGDEEHQAGPTWRSVCRVAQQQKQKICPST